jgi:hypothetical protein
VDTRTRWVVGILIVLVVGLGVALIVVAGDNSKNNGTTTSPPTLSTATQRTQTQSTTTQSTTTTVPNGGTGVPTSTAPGGTGGL